MSVFDTWDSWGYCQPCNRLVHVDEDGIIAYHHSSTSTAKGCDGVGMKEMELPDEKA